MRTLMKSHPALAWLWLVLLGFFLLSSCTPPKPPAVTPLPKPVAVPVVLITSSAVGAISFRVTWGDSVVAIQWLGARLLPVELGRVTSGVLVPRSRWDTVAVAIMQGGAPPPGASPWRFEVFEANTGKVGGYKPVSVGLVTIMAGIPK